MKTCNNNHDMLVHSGKECPLCEAIAEIVNEREMRQDAQRRLRVLREALIDSPTPIEGPAVLSFHREVA